MHLARYLLLQAVLTRGAVIDEHLFCFFETQRWFLSPSHRMKASHGKPISQQNDPFFHQRLSNEFCQRVTLPVGIWQQCEDFRSCVFRRPRSPKAKQFDWSRWQLWRGRSSVQIKVLCNELRKSLYVVVELNCWRLWWQFLSAVAGRASTINQLFD